MENTTPAGNTYTITDEIAAVAGLNLEERGWADQPFGGDTTARWYLDDTGRIRVVDDADDERVDINAFDGDCRTHRAAHAWKIECSPGTPTSIIFDTIRKAVGWADAQQALADHARRTR
jgi:hypothetical protein